MVTSKPLIAFILRYGPMISKALIKCLLLIYRKQHPFRTWKAEYNQMISIIANLDDTVHSADSTISVSVIRVDEIEGEQITHHYRSRWKVIWDTDKYTRFLGEQEIRLID
jgi:hypothetical protein